MSLSLEQIEKQLYSYTYGHPKIQTPFGYKYVINADVTASGFPNKLVEAHINNHILPLYANTHSNAYSGRLMSHYIQEAKTLIKKSINAHDDDQVIFTGNGCSGVVNHLIHCLDLKNHSPEETVVMISKAEHHSNHLPWRHLPVTIIYLPLLKNGLINLEYFERELIKYQRFPNIIASLSATSNVTGVHQQTQVVSQLVHKYGGTVFWDFAASAPYEPLNMHADDASGKYYDAIFISTHKFFGGPETPGLLIANRNLFKNEVPYCPSGGTVRFACPNYQTYSQNIETKETGGTPNIVGSIKAGLVFDFKNRYQSYIEAWERKIVRYAQAHLSKVPNIKLLNPVNNLDRQPIFVFLMPHVHYNLIVVLLNDLFGIQTRGGISCCSLLAQDLLGITPQQQKQIHDQIVNDRGNPAEYGWCRVSFHYSMPMFIVDYILYAIEFVATHGLKLKKLYKYYPAKNTWLYCPDNCPWNDFSTIKLSLDEFDKKIPITYLDPTMLGNQLSSLQKELAKKGVHL